MPGAGTPTLVEDGVRDCLVLFNWRTSLLCDQEEIDQFHKIHPDVHAEPTDSPVVGDQDDEEQQQHQAGGGGGASWGHVVLVLLLVLVLAGVLYTYRQCCGPVRFHSGDRSSQHSF